MPNKKNKNKPRHQTKRNQAKGKPIYTKRPEFHQVTSTESIARKKHLKKLDGADSIDIDVTELIQTRQTVVESYRTSPISPKIVSKLAELNRNKQVLTYEIGQGSGADKERLLSQLIGPYVIKYIKQITRIYYCSFVEQRTKALYKYYIKDIGDTVGGIITKMQNAGIKVFLHGGIVRDMFLGIRSSDIDIIYDTDLNSVLDLCKEYKWPCGDINIMYQYVNFGKDKGISLEGSNLQGVFMKMPHDREASVNDLTVDLQTGLLIDISGYGLQDVLDRKIRLSPMPKYWERWAKQDWKKPLRYFKLIQKGFHPMNQATHSFVINYIRDNWENQYEKPTKPPTYMVKRIKHFLITTMTQGIINKDTGKYEFGPTEDKLIPYLKVLKLHLGKDIFNRIVAQFTEDDMRMLKDASVLSSLRSYRNAQQSSDIETFRQLDIKTKRRRTPVSTSSKTKKRTAK